MNELGPSLGELEPLAGKYRIEHIIGRGGMGIVLRAVHLRLDEPVAIKLLLPQGMDVTSAVERFMREARAASKIKSPHVVRVTDVDVLPSGAPYMVMELLDGYTLGDLCRARGPLPAGVVAAYLLQACDAVAEAHALGIVHRDLKPANLFLSRRRDGTGLLKVLDFGISKLGGALQQGDITQTDTLLGSPSYMSPEQLMSSRHVDGRSDIWSLGIVLYQCLTGTVPFKADTLPQICMRVLHDTPEPPAARRAELPGGLSSAVLRCLEKNPDRRFATATELGEALAPFATTSPLRMVEIPARPARDATSPDGLSETLRIVAELSGLRRQQDAALREPSVAASAGPSTGASASLPEAEGQPSRTQGGWDAESAVGARPRSRRRWLLPAAAGALVVGALGALWQSGVLFSSRSGSEAEPSDRGAPTDSAASGASVASSTADSTATTAPSSAPDAPTATAPSSATTSAPSSTAAASAPAKRSRPPATTPTRPKDDPFGQSRR